METWLREFRVPLPVQQVEVLRKGETVSLNVSFPEETVELLRLARYTDSLGKVIHFKSNSPFDHHCKGPAVGGVEDVPWELAYLIKERIDALPEVYKRVLGTTNLERMESILGKGKGTSEELSFLYDTILNSVIPKIEKDVRDIQKQIDTLTAGFAAAPASADILYFKSGRKMLGTVLLENETEVKIKLAYFDMPVKPSKILRIERGLGSGKEFIRRYARARGDVASLKSLLSFGVANHLWRERALVACLILKISPDDKVARLASRIRFPLGACRVNHLIRA